MRIELNDEMLEILFAEEGEARNGVDRGDERAAQTDAEDFQQQHRKEPERACVEHRRSEASDCKVVVQQY